MIVHPAKHLFEAKCPELEEGEEEIFYQHPKYPCQVNQLGMAYWDEGIDALWVPAKNAWVVQFDGKMRTLNSERLAYECYHQRILKNSFRPKPINGNPYDLRMENQEVAKLGEREVPGTERWEFLQATKRYMDERNVAISARGVDPKYYWGMVKLPPLVLNFYLKNGEELEPAEQLPLNSEFKGKHAQLMVRVQQMALHGYTKSQIANITGNPNYIIKYVFKKLKAGNHI